jgi:hypothetical protein
MDESELLRKLAELEAKVDAVYASSEKVRKYLFWSGVVALLLIVVPLFLFPLVLPAFLQSVAVPAGY